MKIVIYLYNYTLSKSMLRGNDEELINLIISLFWELNIDYFSLLYYIEYYYFKIYKYKVFVHIPKDIKIQS